MYSNEYNVYLHSNINEIYDLLKDVKKYHQILPYIKNVNILESLENKIKAYVELEHLFLKLNYYCHIEFRDNYEIHVIGYNGSFKFINAYWQLEKINENKTRVFYKIDFELKSKLQQKIAEKIFGLYQDKLNKKLINFMK